MGAVAAGSRLGNYEVRSRLGAGGMGEVWRAADTKLGRDVAVKVLPDSLAEDAQALVRFEGEARAVAALSHPGILAIFDFGKSNGTAYAVTELLEGATLRERLADGPLPLRKGLELAAQAARALAAAHEKGIVHRDLKPENLFVTEDGRLKILDFGLAKQQAAAYDPALTHSPTVAPSTQPGTVLGTVGYMAPEQVRGVPADGRADIFALGAVLYEMLTGKRAFQKETAAETMTAILREDPPLLGASDPGITPALERVLRHCLEKSPGERFRSAHDLAFALEALSGAASTPSSSGAAATIGVPRRSRRWALAFLPLVLAAGVFLGRAFRPKTAAAPRLVSFQQVTDAPGVESAPTLSPDGKSVVYVGRVGGLLKLYLLRVGGRNPTLLDPASMDDDWQPAFSPDGERIAFRSERDGGGIFLMGSTGESVKRLSDSGFNPTWSPDGKEVVVANGTALFPSDRGAKAGGLAAIEVATGKRRVVSETADAMQPSWSPHGRRVAFWGLRGDSGQRDIFTVAADGSEAKSEGKDVTSDAALDWSPTWSPDGRWLWFASNRGGSMNLWRVPIDEASGRVLGEAEAMTTPSLWSGEISFSKDGSRVAYGSLLWRSTIFRVAFDPKEERTVGAPVPILKSTLPIRDHRVSPDGQWIAFMQSTPQEDIAIARVDGSDYRRLTDDRFRDRAPVWSPDGKEIAFYSDRSGSYQVWTIRPDGSGLAQLVSVDGAANLPIYAPDGKRMALSCIWGDASHAGSFAIADLTSPARPIPATAVKTAEIEDRSFWPTSWSKDGRRLAGVVVRKNGMVSAVAYYDFEAKRIQPVLEGGDQNWKTVVWLSDGRRMLVRDKRGISLVDAETKRSKPLVDVGGYFIGVSVGLSPDDRAMTYTETATEGDVWIGELK